MKKSKIIVLILVVIAIIAIVIIMKRNSYTQKNIEIEYTYCKGFGTRVDIGDITTKINENGATMSYGNVLSKDIEIDKKEFSKLVKIINRKYNKLLKEYREDPPCDAGKQTIKVTNIDNGESNIVGGFGAGDTDEIFIEIQEQIYKTIGGRNKLDDFRYHEVKSFVEDIKKSIENGTYKGR